MRSSRLFAAPARMATEPVTSPAVTSTPMTKALDRTERPAARAGVILPAGWPAALPGHQELAGQQQGAVGPHHHPDEEGQHEVADGHPTQEKDGQDGQDNRDNGVELSAHGI